MASKRHLLLCAVVIMSACTAVVQHTTSTEDAGTGLNETFLIDDNVTKGTLENGLRYVIRHNEKPENRAVLRLALDVGSVLEEDHQQGLAHFVEHMAFNGTANFAKQELIDYLESNGMRFGADLNAHTSFDETVYKLTVPTDSLEVVETAFQNLRGLGPPGDLRASGNRQGERGRGRGVARQSGRRCAYAR